MTPTSAVPPRWVACPKCGERLGVRPEDAGRRGRCRQCGEVFQIRPPGKVASTADAPVPSPDFDERPASVTFACSLCQTRITALTVHVGKQVKCPDCGRKNTIPPPPAPRQPLVPAAMSGDQYALWGVDEAPLPANQTARAPRLHPVHCQRCGTLIYARDEHLGKKLKCPDCGALTLAKGSPDKQRVSALVAGGDEYQLDEAPAMILPVVAPPTPHEAELLEAAQIPAVTAAMAAHKERVIEPPKLRPKRPNNPLITGAWRMIATEEIVARWIMLSLIAGVAAQMLGESLLTPNQGMVEAIKIVFAALGVGIAAIWATMIGPLLVAIVGESSDGNDEVHQAPKWLAFDWFAEFFTALMAGAIAGMLGVGAWKLAQLASAPTAVQIAAGVGVAAMFFPFMLLSAMLEGTPMGVVSPRLLTSFGRCAGPWLLFFAQTFALYAPVGVAAWLLAPTPPIDGPPSGWTWGVPPLAIAALLIDMRLLGRLAWWISDAMEEEKDA